MSRRVLVWVAVLALGVGTVGRAGPVGKEPRVTATIKAKNTWSKLVTFKGGERANVILIGGDNPAAYLALYIFDAQGNCVTRDDNQVGKFLNDRAVIWYPATQKYIIEVRNLGTVDDNFTLAIR